MTLEAVALLECLRRSQDIISGGSVQCVVDNSVLSLLCSTDRADTGPPNRSLERSSNALSATLVCAMLPVVAMYTHISLPAGQRRRTRNEGFV